jgi:hypothetical protein
MRTGSLSGAWAKRDYTSRNERPTGYARHLKRAAESTQLQRVKCKAALDALLQRGWKTPRNELDPMDRDSSWRASGLSCAAAAVGQGRGLIRYSAALSALLRRTYANGMFGFLARPETRRGGELPTYWFEASPRRPHPTELCLLRICFSSSLPFPDFRKRSRRTASASVGKCS